MLKQVNLTEIVGKTISGAAFVPTESIHILTALIVCTDGTFAALNARHVPYGGGGLTDDDEFDPFEYEDCNREVALTLGVISAEEVAVYKKKIADQREKSTAEAAKVERDEFLRLKAKYETRNQFGQAAEPAKTDGDL